MDGWMAICASGIWTFAKFQMPDAQMAIHPSIHVYVAGMNRKGGRSVPGTSCSTWSGCCNPRVCVAAGPCDARAPSLARACRIPTLCQPSAHTRGHPHCTGRSCSTAGTDKPAPAQTQQRGAPLDDTQARAIRRAAPGSARIVEPWRRSPRPSVVLQEVPRFDGPSSNWSTTRSHLGSPASQRGQSPVCSRRPTVGSQYGAPPAPRDQIGRPYLRRLWRPSTRSTLS